MPQVVAELGNQEYQKRDLPHFHDLFWLHDDDEVRTDNIDDYVCAEIPDPDEDLELYELVTKFMIHSPCGIHNPGAKCMKDGRCKRGYPKAFQQTTDLGGDKYPLYRRRSCDNGGKTTTVSFEVSKRRVEMEVGNEWVVPYNPWLLRQFQCHMNVEICTSVQSIHYVLKYTCKGDDQATYSTEPTDPANPNTPTSNQQQLTSAQAPSDQPSTSTEQQPPAPVDEIKKFEQGKFMGCHEAVATILGLQRHYIYPNVVPLKIHLEGEQRVYFPETGTVVDEDTTLTAFFKLCQRDDFARTLLYHETPEYYTLKKKTWYRRKASARSRPVPGIDGIYRLKII